MKATLYHRFQGTLWGAAIAHPLPSSVLWERGLTPLSAPVPGSPTWESYVLQGYQQLITGGKLVPEEFPLAPPAEVMGVLIPLSLYFHEDHGQLTRQWQAMASCARLNLEWEASGLAIALALCSLIQEIATPPTLVTQLRSLLHPLHPLAAAWLDPLLLSLPSHSGRTQSESPAIDSQPLLWGLACFLSSTQAFPAAVAIAQRLPSSIAQRLPSSITQNTTAHPILTTRITGSLCGAYQTLVGIPVPWQYPQPPTLRAHLNTLSAYLLASWAGADLTTLECPHTYSEFCLSSQLLNPL